MSLQFGSKARSNSSSNPVFYGPSKIMLPQQKAMWGATAPSLLEKAMRGGYSPADKARLYTRTAENINAGVKGGINNLRATYAKSGLRGGVMGGDISSILESAIQARGQASQGIEDMSRQYNDQNWQRLLQMAQWRPPAMLGQRSKSSYRGSGWKFGIGTAQGRG
jgi:hypothetical protein